MGLTRVPNRAAGDGVTLVSQSPSGFARQPLAQAVRIAILAGAVAAIPAGAVSAAQILPNDNTGTITVIGDDFNALDPFNNLVLGTISVDGGGTLTNTSTGVLNNDGYIENYGTLNNDGTLTNEGFVDNYGTLNNRSELSNNSYLYNEGGLSNENGATLINDNGLYNGFSGGSALLMNDGDSEVVNNGLLGNYGGSNVSNAGALTNDGELFNESGSSVSNGGTLTNNGMLYNEGRVVNESGGLLQNSYSGLLYNSDSLENDAGAQLSSSGLLVNFYSVTNAGSVDNTGNLYNFGGLDNVSGGTLVNNYDMMNYGVLTNRDGAQLTNNAYLMNADGAYAGELVNESGAVLNNGTSGVLYNSGQITNDGDLRNGGILISHGAIENNGRIDNSGVFVVDTLADVVGDGEYVQDAGLTLVDGLLQAAVMDFTGGALGGNGILESASAIDIGTGVDFSPGSSVGTFGVMADTLFGGDLFIELTGLSTFDLVDAAGYTFDFESGASITFDFSFLPAIGDSFAFLLADSVLDSGLASLMFQAPDGSSVDGVLNLTVGGLALDITAVDQNVPAPGSLLLLPLGLLGIAWGRRRSADG